VRRASRIFTQHVKNIWINHEFFRAMFDEFNRFGRDTCWVTPKDPIFLMDFIDSRRRIRSVMFSKLLAFVRFHCANFGTTANISAPRYTRKQKIAVLLQFLARGTLVSLQSSESRHLSALHLFSFSFSMKGIS